MARLHENRPPDKTEIDDVARRVHDRAVRWLRRHGNIDERPLDERNNEPTDATPMDGLSRIAPSGGTFLTRPFAPKEHEDDKLERKQVRFAASLDGFDVHCGVRVGGDEDEGRERLARHCARLRAVDRIERMKEGIGR